jgi:predicted dienelactone hydrolase
MAGYACGYSVSQFHDAGRSRPVIVDLWYPATDETAEAVVSYGLSVGRAAQHAPPAPGPFPVCVLTHGAFGAARNYSWLAEALARGGYVVVGVSHYLESFVYGPETVDPAAVGQLRDRALDCTVALDRVLEDPVFSAVVDPDRVAAIGHSSGGATVLVLAGAAFDPSVMQAYCAGADPTIDRGCAYGDRLETTGAPASSVEEVVSAPDARVRSVVAMDPALGPGFLADSLALLSLPVHFVGSTDNDFLPFDQHVGRCASLVPACSLDVLSSGEGHFVYLDECAADVDANGVSLCRDRPGVDRAAVHDRLVGVIAEFLARTLELG